MYQIHAGQIKAARAILDWSREDMARLTGLSINTIRNLEMGFMSPRGTTVEVIRQAVENAGLEFTEAEGIRRRSEDIKVIQGPDSCDIFFEDLLQTIKTKGAEIAAIFGSQKLMAGSLGMIEGLNLSRLDELSALACVKCIFTEIAEPLSLLTKCQLRTLPKHTVSPVPYYVYGDKHALVLPEGLQDFRFVVIKSFSLAQSYRNHFNALWMSSNPLRNAPTDNQRCVRA